MVIRVLDRNYFVVQTLPSETGLSQYVCRNVTEDDGCIYRIVRIPVAEADPGLVRWLSGIYRAAKFRELVQYANEQDYLQVVVNTGSERAVSLEKRLGGETISLKERLFMGKHVLERLILSDVPLFFAAHALSPDHVRFTDAGDCCFTYELEHLKDYDGADVTEVMAGIRAVLGGLFAEELKYEKIPELTALQAGLLQKEYSSVMEVYKAYEPIVAEYSGRPEEKLESKSLPFRIWEKIKAAFRFLGKLFFLVVLLLAVAYLVISVRNFMAPTRQMDVYKSIGDMEIISGTAEETEGQDE